jgi:tRNA(Ile2) C34 agmatinyltransferase TiaS
MQFLRCNVARPNADVMSGILNCVCPECGGRMGGAGKEFKCQGECGTDWRPVWERDRSTGFDRRSQRAF